MITDFLREGKLGSIEFEDALKKRKQLTERWDSVHFLDGLQGEMKNNIAQLYENQARQMLSEAADSSNSGQFQTVVFPIIRRVFSKLLANDIVSVQAINIPTGKIFYILPQTSEREWLAADGEPLTSTDALDPTKMNGAVGKHTGLMGYRRINRNDNGNIKKRFYLPDEVVNAVGTANEPEVAQYYEKTLYDLFYDDFLFDNSKGQVHIKVGTLSGATINPDGSTTYTSGLTGVADAYGSYRSAYAVVTGFNSYGAGKLVGPDGNEMDTEEFLASLKVVAKSAITGDNFTTYEQGEPIKWHVVAQRYGRGIVDYGNKYCNADGKLLIELELCKPTTGSTQTVDGFIGVSGLPAASDLMITWAQYDSLELETEMGEVSFTLTSTTIDVSGRKLRATWSPELAQDVQAFHSIDAEAEMTALLSEQIMGETDREILRDLRRGAAWSRSFDVNGWKRINTFSTNYTQKDWNQELFTVINQISAQIQKSTLQGGANFVVISSPISAVFDNLEYFHATDASAESNTYALGIERIGSLNNRYTVYVDPLAPDNSMIVGHKGKNMLDTGYVYAPYIPMQLSPVLTNVENFAPVRGIMTRYAKKMINNRYYGHIKVFGLTVFDPRLQR